MLYTYERTQHKKSQEISSEDDPPQKFNIDTID